MNTDNSDTIIQNPSTSIDVSVSGPHLCGRECFHHIQLNHKPSKSLLHVNEYHDKLNAANSETNTNLAASHENETATNSENETPHTPETITINIPLNIPAIYRARLPASIPDNIIMTIPVNKPVNNYTPISANKYINNNASISATNSTNQQQVINPTTTKFPVSFSLSSKYKLNVLDQSSIGACVVNSFACIMNSLHNISPSRLYMYFNARVGTGNSPIEDTGLDLLQSLPILASFGLPSENTWPYIVSKYNIMPPYSNTYHNISNSPFAVNYNVITQTDNAIKTALSAGKFVILGIDIYSSFMTNNVANTGIIPMPNTNTETLEGGHCIHIVGWCTLNSIAYYIIRNTWGLSWGNNGATTPVINFSNNKKNGGFGYIPVSYILDPILAYELMCVY